MSPRLRLRRDAKSDARSDAQAAELVGFVPTIGVALGAVDPALGTPVYDENLERIGFEFIDHADVLAVSSPGLGAWTFYYRYGWKPSSPRQSAGLRAIKVALIANGYGKGIDVEMQVFGGAATNRTKEFQHAHGLTADGVIGPKTARALFRLYYDSAEQDTGIPDHLLAKTGYGESSSDPIAEGVTDAEDEGILQFHLPYWPGVTEEQAWDPSYEITHGAEKLASLRRITGSWKGAVAAWNIGATYARFWVIAGYPPAGGPIMGTDPNTGQPIDSFTRATNYWAYIDALPY